MKETRLPQKEQGNEREKGRERERGGEGGRERGRERENNLHLRARSCLILKVE